MCCSLAHCANIFAVVTIKVYYYAKKMDLFNGNASCI